MSFSLLTLGAGQEVGRSCVIANLNGMRIMFDCGVHMVYNDSRRFPDFRRMIDKSSETPISSNIYANFQNTKDIDYNKELDLILITHFHLDHIGSLPYFTELCNFKGKILMTQPTKAIAPVILEDFRRVISDYKGEKSIISYMDIKNCLSKIETIELFEERIVKERIKITPFYAGHVLGAVMYRVEINGFSMIYTGDYNTSFDRHLNGAYLPKLNPDVLITETTYGDTIRDTKRSREREFLKKVTQVINRNGKVLIPTFALGRAQEICLLLDTHWKRNKIKCPIYFFGALSEKSNFYYKIFNNWQNETVKNMFLDYNIFEFENIISSNLSKGNEIFKATNTAMVILATPGMLHAGTSLNIFKEICEDDKNCVIIPGFCTPGTVGYKVLLGEKEVDIDKKKYKINCEINYMSFSGHADAKGLLSLIKNSNPKNLVLVHGDSEIMSTFKSTVENILPMITTYMPQNYKKIMFNEKIIYKQIGFSYDFFNIINTIYMLNNKKSLKDRKYHSNFKELPQIIENNNLIFQSKATEVCVTKLINENFFISKNGNEKLFFKKNTFFKKRKDFQIKSILNVYSSEKILNEDIILYFRSFLEKYSKNEYDCLAQIINKIQFEISVDLNKNDKSQFSTFVFFSWKVNLETFHYKDDYLLVIHSLKRRISDFLNAYILLL